MLLKKMGFYDQVDIEKLVYSSLILDFYTSHINILCILRSPEIENLLTLFNSYNETFACEEEGDRVEIKIILFNMLPK